jgi:hypothetical protein
MAGSLTIDLGPKLRHFDYRLKDNKPVLWPVASGESNGQGGRKGLTLVVRFKLPTLYRVRFNVPLSFGRADKSG